MTRFNWTAILLLTLLMTMLWLPKANAQEVAQTYTLAVFAAVSADPNTSTPVAPPVDYNANQVQCGLPRQTVPPSVVNPSQALFEDPNDTTKDCQVNAGAQLNAIPLGNGYKAALKANGATVSSAYSSFSNSFNRALTPPPVPAGVRVR